MNQVKPHKINIVGDYVYVEDPVGFKVCAFPIEDVFALLVPHVSRLIGGPEMNAALMSLIEGVADGFKD